MNNNYIDKFNKYKDKVNINYFGGDSDMKNLPKSSIEIILYTISSLDGGDTKQIISIIHTEYNKVLEINKKRNKNYKLGIKAKDDSIKKLNFRIQPHTEKKKNNTISPAFKNGSSTVIYELRNEFDKKDEIKYLLRLIDSKPVHLCDLLKVKTEFELYKKYMYSVYYYGILNVLETGHARPHRMDYIITKFYNTDITKFTDKQKYKLLINIIQMFIDLKINNSFHADFKLENIGWDDNLNIILIDYDDKTIITINETIYTKTTKDYYKLNFPYTYVPKYLESDEFKFVKNINYIKYDKFSVGGLTKLISELLLKDDLITEYKLNDSYENILSYEKMLESLNKKLLLI
jgi:hypothetical protein